MQLFADNISHLARTHILYLSLAIILSNLNMLNIYYCNNFFFLSALIGAHLKIHAYSSPSSSPLVSFFFSFIALSSSLHLVNLARAREIQNVIIRLINIAKLMTDYLGTNYITYTPCGTPAVLHLFTAACYYFSEHRDAKKRILIINIFHILYIYNNIIYIYMCVCHVTSLCTYFSVCFFFPFFILNIEKI